MIKLFRQLSPLNIVILVIVALVLRAGFLINLPEKINIDLEEPFSRILSNELIEEQLSPLSNVLIAMVITLIQAMIFNRIINIHNLLGKPSFLPALMYVTVCSVVSPFLVISAPLISNFIMIWMISKILDLYRSDGAGSIMFDLGMIVSAGTMIYFPFFGMLPLLWLSLMIFRPFNWREWVAVLVGFATIYFFVAVYYYWNDILGDFYYILLPLTRPALTPVKLSPTDYIPLIPLTFIFLVSSISLWQIFFKSYVQIRKGFQMFLMLLVLALISVGLKEIFQINHFILTVAPLSIIIAYYFINARKRWIYETLYLLLAGFIIYFQVF